MLWKRQRPHALASASASVSSAHALAGSQQPGNANEDDEIEEIPTVDSWTDHTSRLVVTSSADCTCTVTLRAKVDLPPEKLYEILTSPMNNLIFRGVKRVVDRRIVDDRKGIQTVDVTQEGQWRFLMFRGRFQTRLLVEEDSNTHTVRFRQISPGFMRRFEGTWTLAPFTQETLDELYDKKHKHKWLGLRKAVAAVEHSIGVHRPVASLATLEQSITPALAPPKPLRPVIGCIVQDSVLNILKDLQVAAKKIQNGELEWPPRLDA